MDSTNKTTIKVVNRLIETCKDGEYGFNRCAEHAENAQLSEMFNVRANECRQAGVELQAIVTGLGGTPEDDGTAAGALHRGWVAVRAKLSTYTEQAMLEECERGEDVALSRYREALDEDALPVDVRATLERQYQGVKRNHAQIRTLRDRARAHA